MKLVSYRIGNAERFGIVTDGGIVELNERTGATSLRNLLLGAGLGAAEDYKGETPDHQLAEIEYLPVIPDANKIVCIGVNYADHAEEMWPGQPFPKYPTVFARFPDSQVGHNVDIARPHHSEKLDYECELAVVIGKGGRDILKSEAFGHVAGYACYNDISVRDYQSHSSQFTPGKNFTGCGSFGPWMVTPDELGALGSKRIKTRVNGELRQNAAFETMLYPVDHLIAYVSQWSALQPGDVIITGTPSGVAAGMKPPRWMKPGDTVEVEIDGIGVLRNKIT